MYVMMAVVANYGSGIVFFKRAMILRGTIGSREIHCSQNIFLKLYCNKILKKAAENSLLLVKILMGICICAFLSVLIINTGLDYFFNKTDYPLPFPIYIPGLKPNDFNSYLINWINQILMMFSFVNGFCSIVCAGLFAAVYVLARLDSVIELNKNMKNIEKDGGFEEYCRTVMTLIIKARE